MRKDEVKSVAEMPKISEVKTRSIKKNRFESVDRKENQRKE